MTTTSPTGLRWYARAVAALDVFAPLLASQPDGADRLAPLAALSLGLVAFASRFERREPAFVVTVVGLVAAGFVAHPTTAWLLRRGAVGVLDAGLVIAPVFHAALLAPLVFAARQNAPHDTDDARDRLLLASATAAFVALLEVTLRVEARRYDGAAAIALGPTMIALLAVSALGALGAFVLGTRGLLRYGRLLTTPGVRIVAREAWPGTVPARAWWRTDVPNDGVLVRRTANATGAYRAGEVDEALTRLPQRAEAVTNWLWSRLAIAGTILLGVALLSLTVLPTLRW